MTPPRPAGDGERCTCGRTRRACDAAFLSYYDADHPAAPAPWLATPSEPTVEAELAELADLREKVARVEALAVQWELQSSGFGREASTLLRRALDG